VSGLFAFLPSFGQGDRPLKIANLRFYSPGDDSSGATKSQGDKDDSQGEESTKEKTSEEQGSDEGKEKAEDEKLTRENAKWRGRVRELEAQVSELSQKAEEAENAKLTDAEKFQKERDKERRQLEQAQREAKEAKKLVLAIKAVSKHQLPEDFAARLLGETEEDFEEDAKALAAYIDRLAREKYRPKAPDTEGGDRHEKNGSKVTEQERRQMERSYKQGV
jgi:hypothetical protein